MPRVVNTAVFQAPVSAIFAYLAQAERNIEWVPRLAYSERLTPGPTRSGTRFRFGVKFAGVTVDSVDEVVEVVPDRLIRFRGTTSVTHTGSWQLEPVAAGEATQVTYDIDFELPAVFGPVMARLLNLRHLLEEQSQDCLQNLRLMLERADAAAASTSVQDTDANDASPRLGN